MNGLRKTVGLLVPPGSSQSISIQQIYPAILFVPVVAVITTTPVLFEAVGVNVIHDVFVQSLPAEEFFETEPLPKTEFPPIVTDAVTLLAP